MIAIALDADEALCHNCIKSPYREDFKWALRQEVF